MREALKRVNWLFLVMVVASLIISTVAVNTIESRKRIGLLVEGPRGTAEEMEVVEEDWVIKRRFRQHNGRVAPHETFDCDLVFTVTETTRIRGWIVGITLGEIWKGTKGTHIGGCTEVTRINVARTNYALDRCFTYGAPEGVGVVVNKMEKFYDRQTSDDLGLLLEPGESIAVHSNLYNGIGVRANVVVFVIWFYEEIDDIEQGGI